ncbi:MAG: hypothetical protein WA322_15985 [Pseudolabrys sp.]
MPRPHRVDPSSSRSVAVPIFTYLAVAGSMLIALLLVTDATREKGTPTLVANNQPIQSLAAVPAPAPEAQSPEVLANVEPTAHAEQAEEPPKKKRVTGRHRRQNHAWSRSRNLGQR